MPRFGAAVRTGVVVGVAALSIAACERNNGEATPPETPITGAVPAAPLEASAAASSDKPTPTLSVAADGGVSQTSP